MTKQQAINKLYKIGEVFYQRSFKLREYSENQNNPYNKRLQAWLLWNTLFQRLISIKNKVQELQQPDISKFKNGGIITK